MVVDPEDRLRRLLLSLIPLAGAALGWPQGLPSLPKPLAPPAAREHLASPRTTLETFLSSMATRNIERARETMDLGSFNFVTRDIEAERLAIQLYTVLNRTPGLSPELAPFEAPSGLVDLRITPGKNLTIGVIQLRPNAKGEWLFDSETMRNLPALYETARRWPAVGGYPEWTVSPVEMEVWIRDRLPSSLMQRFLGLELWQLLGLLLLLAATGVAYPLGRGIAAVLLRFRRKHLSDRIVATSVRGLKRAIGFVLSAALWSWVLPMLALPNALFVPLAFVLKVVWALALGRLCMAVFDASLDMVATRGTDRVKRVDSLLIPITRKFGKFMIVAIVFVGLLSSLDVNVAGLVAGLGIGGLVVALAAKDSVENVFGSLTILFDMPFGVDDWVKIGDVEGVVEEINLRSTRIRTFEDSVITLPNSNLIKASVENFGARRFRRLRFTLPISHANPMDRVTELIERVRGELSSNDHVRQENAYVSLHTLNEGHVGVMVQAYLLANTQAEELELRASLLTKVVQAANETGVVLGSVTWAAVLPPSEEMRSPDRGARPE